MILALAWLLGCPSDERCDGARDLAGSPAGLALTEEEHPDGWGRAACFQCHQRWEVHAEDCIEGVAVDTEALGAVTDCVACHGANGLAADTGETR